MNTISQKSYAKINLNLNVVGKTKNLHKLQSIVSLISLYDEISLRQTDSRKHKILFKGKFSKSFLFIESCAIAETNLKSG